MRAKVSRKENYALDSPISGRLVELYKTTGIGYGSATRVSTAQWAETSENGFEF